MENTVKTLTGLTAVEEALLADERVVNAEELSLITYEDLTGVLPTANKVKKRKLELIGEYVGRGKVLTDKTTIMGIQAYVLSTASTATQQQPRSPHLRRQQPATLQTQVGVHRNCT